MRNSGSGGHAGDDSHGHSISSLSALAQDLSDSASAGSKKRKSGAAADQEERKGGDGRGLSSASGNGPASSFHDGGTNSDGDDGGRGDEADVDFEGFPSRNCCENVAAKVGRVRVLCGRFVNNDRVQLVVVALIAINAIMMGVATFDFVTDDPATEDLFERIDQGFLIVFTAELILQFLYHGLRLFLDGWLLFDFVVIVTSWAFTEAQIIRAFRIFRALRLITRVEVMRNLVKALFAVMPNMTAIALLLALVMYIFSVMFTQLFKYMFADGHLEYDYFSRLDKTFFTLFQIMTFDAWADPAREVMVVYAWSWVLFIAWVVVSGFIFVNLIVAVICDAIAALHDEERALLHGRVRDDSDSEFDDMDELDEDMNEDERDGGGEDGSGEGERHKGGGLHVERQIKLLERQIDRTKRMQEQTERIIQYLTEQLQRIPTPRR